MSNATADSDRELDEWSFFTTIAEDIEELRRRVEHKLAYMDIPRRHDLYERESAHLIRLRQSLRQARTAATHCAGRRPRLAVTRASRA